MKIKRIEIQNFRSIIDPLVIDNIGPLIVFTGPNNVGKSNILKALDLFFNGAVEGTPYTPEHDLPQGVITASNNPETKIRLNLLIELKDINVRQNLSSRLKPTEKEYNLDIEMKCRKRKTDWKEIITITSETGNGPKKIAADEANNSFNILRKHVDYRYIPSIKDARKIMAEQLIDEIKDAAFDPYGVGPKKPQEIENRKQEWIKIQGLINELFSELGEKTKILFKEVFPEIQKLNILTGQDQLKQVIGDLQVVLDDGANTSLYFKGSGIQTAAIIYFLKILATRPRQAPSKKEPIWAIEEPETFLHPKAQKEMAKKLWDYANQDGIQTFITTHSPLFICRRDKDSNKLLAKRQSSKYKNLNTTAITPTDDQDIWKPFREELGIDIRDTLLFHDYNIIVEGETDIYLLKEVIKQMESNNDPKVIPLSRLEFRRYRGADAIPKYYEVFNNISDKAQLLALFDADEKGLDIKNRLSNKNFKEEKDFIICKRTGFQYCDLENLAEQSILEKIISDYPQKCDIVKKEEPYKTGVRYVFHRGRDSEKKIEIVEKILKYSNYNQLHRYVELIHKIYNIFTRSGQLNFENTSTSS